MKRNEKDNLRNYIWNSLRNKGLSNRPKGDHGKIPDFKGSFKAAQLLTKTIEWDKAHTIFCSPDTAQKMVRELALRDGKDLIMPSPKLKRGYFFINHKDVQSDLKIVSTAKGALRFGKKIEKFPEVDLVVEGSVAVDQKGNRLGKGGGYGDREIKELFIQEVINQETSIATTVHDLQIVDNVPTQKHDEKINMIVTPEAILRLSQDPTIPLVK